MYAERTFPNSSRVHLVSYDTEQQVLAVQLKTRDGAPENKVRHYRDVPERIARGFDAADSAGRYYAQHVHRRFDCDVVPIVHYA